MSTAFTLSRRSFILAGATLGLTVALPGLAFAESAGTTADSPEDFDPAGTWLLVATACDDEDVDASLGLLAGLSTTVYELRADGTLTCTMTPLLMDDGDDQDDASSDDSTPAQADATSADNTPVDDLNKALTEKVARKGTWEVAEDGQVTLSTDDGAVLALTHDGLGLIYTGRDEDGLTITMTFAQVKDVLSGDWMVARSPEDFDLAHEDMAGEWRCVAWIDLASDDVQAAHYSATMLDGSGFIFELSVAEDGSFSMGTGDSASEPTQGVLSQTKPGVYECGVDSDILNFTLEDGKITLTMGDGKLVFAPLATTD